MMHLDRERGEGLRRTRGVSQAPLFCLMVESSRAIANGHDSNHDL